MKSRNIKFESVLSENKKNLEMIVESIICKEALGKIEILYYLPVLIKT